MYVQFSVKNFFKKKRFIYLRERMLARRGRTRGEGEREERNNGGFQSRSGIKRTDKPFYLKQQQQNFVNRKNT